jgi:replicative DNA helicase
MNERIPPHSDDAEKSVLGALMLDKDALSEIMEKLRDEDFYSEAHREIFRAAAELCRSDKPVDTLTLSDELKRRASLDRAGGRSYIAELSTMVPATANAAQYANIVAEKAILRRLIKASSNIMEDAYQAKRDAKDILDAAERGIFEIAHHDQSKDYALLSGILIEHLKHVADISALRGLTGLTTGFTELDKRTSGLQKSDLIIVAARPGMGKTAFSLNIAHKAAVRAGAKILVFSLEMSKEQISNRLLSLESHVEITRLRDGRLSDDDWLQIHKAVDVLSNAAIYIDDTPGVSVMEIKNKSRRMKAEHGLDLIVVDYLQLMSSDGRSENRQQEITAITRMLKQLAREMDCPVIVLSQLSRSVETRGGKKRPILSDLRESGAIEQDADIVIFLYREDYYDEEAEEQNACEVILAKHRNGETGSVELSWVGRYTKFADRAPDIAPDGFDL